MMASAHPGATEARAFLAGHLGCDVGAVEPVGAGAWSLCFGFRIDGESRVVRFSRYQDDFEKDRRAAGFAMSALPVPEVFEIGQAFGGYFAISSRGQGEMLEGLDADGWRAVLPSLFAALDAMRAIDLSSTRGYGGWSGRGDAQHGSWRDFLVGVEVDTSERRTHGWRERLRQCPDAHRAFGAGLARMRALADALPAPRRSVVHADLINGNVLVAGGRLTAVLDWGCSFYGDFLYDLAWLAFWAPWHPQLEEIDIIERAKEHYASIGLDVPSLGQRIRVCMLHIGLDHLAYHAHREDRAALGAVTCRLLPVIDGWPRWLPS
jgi:hygromycin-B 4-O-kinase